MSFVHQSRLAVLAAAALIVFTSCSRESESEPDSTGQTSSRRVASPELMPQPVAKAIAELESVEDLSEEVAHRLIELSDWVRKRDYEKARAYFATSFLGSRVDGLAKRSDEDLGCGARRTWLDAAAKSPPLGREAFLESLEVLLQPLASIDFVLFKPRGAEFESDKRRGVLKMTIQIIGRQSSGRPWSFYAWTQSEAVPSDEKSSTDSGDSTAWVLRRIALEKARVESSPAAIFTDVASSAGIAQVEPRLGTVGNDKFYWRGAATADVDGDGLWDIFTTGASRRFLYRNLGSGGFEDVTEKAGLAGKGGSTGVLFVDFDNDGDSDLFLAHVGWRVDGVPYGGALLLYRNDGAGVFKDVTDEVGLGKTFTSAFSLCAADVDNDGWLDLFVSNYNRLDAVYPNSWYRATNGEPNLLFKNVKGRSFEQVAAQAGVAGTDWSYAAAFADWDEDGDQDLYVANDYGDNCFYRNRGDGTFENVAKEMGVLDTGNGMGATWGDLNADGRLDLYVSNMSSSAGNRILRRLAKSSETETSVQSTLSKLAAGNTIFLQGDGGKLELLDSSRGGIGASWAWSASILDIDLDGAQDVYVANGFISGDSLKDT